LNRADVAQCLYPYFDIRDELTLQGKLVFKGQQLVVPISLRKKLREATHASHIGVEPCIRQARDSLYWPSMTTKLKEYIAKCDVRMVHCSEQSKEPIQRHDFAARSWSKVAADLCDLDGHTVVVVSDCKSNYIEVARITSITSRSSIRELKAVFARFSIPEVLVTNNGAQFSLHQPGALTM